MQNPFGGRMPVGIVYNTSMTSPAAALALAVLFQYEGKREARTAALAVSGSGFATAVYCDILIHFYFGSGGPVPNSNRLLPVGLTLANPMPPDPAFLAPIVNARDEKGQFQFPRSIRRPADTAEVPALLRNSLTGMQDNNVVMILSGPAAGLARSLDLPGTLEMAAKKIKALVVCDAAPQPDPAALQSVLSRWPTPIVLCGGELGETFRFPAAAVESGFAWNTKHPVAGAYRAFAPMPHNAAACDVAAMLYAIKPDSGFWELSEAAPGAKHRQLRIASGRLNDAVQAMVELATAKPAPRVSPFRRSQTAETKQPEAIRPAVKK